MFDAIRQSLRPATRRLHKGYTWDEIANMDDGQVAREVARQYTRQRDTWAWTIARVVVMVTLGVVGAVWWHPLAGPVAGVALVVAGFYATQCLQRAWGYSVISSVRPQRGRMQAVTVMLTRTQRGGCDRAMVRRLLTSGPSEMTCSALGHVKDFCPHAKTAW